MDAFLSELWMILVESSIWLIAGFLLAGLVHAFVPRDALLKNLGASKSKLGLGPVVKASLLGIPLPLCSCSVIPVASGLRRGGASKGASAAFAISTPQTGEESVPLTWGLFGPVYALTRPVVAVVTALTAGLLINIFVRDETQSNNEDYQSCCSASETTTRQESTVSLNVLDERTKPRFAMKLSTALSHGFGTMLVDLAFWLTIGIVTAAAIAAFVPQSWIESHAGGGIVPMLAMLVIGIPVYICATSSTPLVYSLVVSGLSPGAGLVMLLAGPATNTATMGWLIKDLGVRALVIYLLTIATIALGAGLAFDAFLAHTIVLADQSGLAHQHASAWGATKDIAAVFMVILLARSLGKQASSKLIKPKSKRHDSGCCSSESGSTANSNGKECCG